MSKEDDKIENYLKKVVDTIMPQRSKDPEENECLNCFMTEKSHQVGLPIACDNFE